MLRTHDPSTHATRRDLFACGSCFRFFVWGSRLAGVIEFVLKCEYLFSGIALAKITRGVGR
jgi:hypothetical protein